MGSKILPCPRIERPWHVKESDYYTSAERKVGFDVTAPWGDWLDAFNLANNSVADMPLSFYKDFGNIYLHLDHKGPAYIMAASTYSMSEVTFRTDSDFNGLVVVPWRQLRMSILPILRQPEYDRAQPVSFYSPNGLDASFIVPEWGRTVIKDLRLRDCASKKVPNHKNYEYTLGHWAEDRVFQGISLEKFRKTIHDKAEGLEKDHPLYLSVGKSTIKVAKSEFSSGTSIPFCPKRLKGIFENLSGSVKVGLGRPEHGMLVDCRGTVSSSTMISKWGPPDDE